MGHVTGMEITPTEPSRLSGKGEEVIPPKEHRRAVTGKRGERRNQRFTSVQYTIFIE